jgi:hypothetical protein
MQRILGIESESRGKTLGRHPEGIAFFGRCIFRKRSNKGSDGVVALVEVGAGPCDTTSVIDDGLRNHHCFGLAQQHHCFGSSHFLEFSCKTLIFDESFCNPWSLFKVSVEFRARERQAVVDVVRKAVQSAIGGRFLRGITRCPVVHRHMGKNHLKKYYNIEMREQRRTGHAPGC